MLAAAVAACLAVAGCGSSKSDPPAYSLTVFVYDAITNQPIPTASLVSGMVLYEGKTQVVPVALDAKRPGAVIFQNVPFNYTANTQSLPLFVTLGNYLPWQGKVTFSAAANANVYVNSSPQDGLLAQQGVVYVYPTSYQAPNYTFTVVSPAGMPVPNATVEFDPNFGGVNAVQPGTGT